MRNDHSPAEKAQIALGAGFSAALLARLILRGATDAPVLLIAIALGLFGAVCICYGVGQLAVSRGRSAAWGFAGFVGYIIVRYILKPRTPAGTVPQTGTPTMPPPPPPPGYVPPEYVPS
ncbi:MAG TPA: hypothetical protein VG318_00460 [Actinomycetota bacterium]|nr:hypothetical protein [Actinomycetota bacterium]